MGENVQDSVLDQQLRLPQTYQGAIKILDNQQSLSLICNTLGPVDRDGSDQGTTSRGPLTSERREKTTTIKKLAEN